MSNTLQAETVDKCMTAQELAITFPEARKIVIKTLSGWRGYQRRLEPLWEELLDAGMAAIYESADLTAHEKSVKTDEWKALIYDRDPRYEGRPIPHGLTRHYTPKGIAFFIKENENLLWAFDHAPDVMTDGMEEVELYHYMPTDEVSPEDLYAAKRVPITMFLEKNMTEPLRHIGNMVRCPFHSERTPSCKIYEDNHAHCFGCDKTFDVIDLVIAQKGMGFKEAVKFLIA